MAAKQVFPPVAGPQRKRCDGFRRCIVLKIGSAVLMLLPLSGCGITSWMSDKTGKATVSLYQIEPVIENDPDQNTNKSQTNANAAKPDGRNNSSATKRNGVTKGIDLRSFPLYVCSSSISDADKRAI